MVYLSTNISININIPLQYLFVLKKINNSIHFHVFDAQKNT